ncbi:MAG: DMT family transporter [Luminiphilus sp.]|jgi:drug/metabolite transporter (DMT)-like permease|nr:DMT family transporter [Luminiphilus sp.]
MSSLNARSNQESLLFGLMAVGLWSTMATAFKWALLYTTPMQLITAAATVSWLFFAMRLAVSGSLRSVMEVPRTIRWRCLILGLLNPGLYYWILFQAYDLLPAQDAMAINYTWGLTLPLIASLFSKIVPTRSEIGLALLSYLGILIIVTDGDLSAFEFTAPLGVLLALLSTVIWGLSWVLNSRFVDTHQLNPEVTLFLNFTAATPILWLLTTLSDGAIALTWASILSGLYVGLLEMGIAFVLWMNALRLTNNPIRVSSLIFLAPPLSLVLITTVLGEPISQSTLLGLVVILLGLAGQQFVSQSR